MNKDNQGITPKEKVNMGISNTAQSMNPPQYDPMKDILSDSPDLNKLEIIIDPSLEEREKLYDRYYFVSMSCSNCHHPIHFSNIVDVMIPKGVPVPNKPLKCPNCELETLS